MPATTGMKGAGYYDRHSTAQMSVVHALRDWIDDAVVGLPLPAAAQPVSVLDLGSSEGGNAIRLLGDVVEGLRRRTGQPIQTTCSDLAGNDFNQLFANLEKARRGGLFPAGVYPGATAGSFYGPLMPPGTVHLATCFNAIHWLDRLPEVPLPDCVAYRRPHPPRPGPVVSAAAAAAFSRQAEQDLVRFLGCRAREIVPGGKLLLAGPGDSDQACIADGIDEVLRDACLDLVAAGSMTRQEYERFTMPCYWRTVGELLAPLEREDSPLHETFAVDRAAALEIPTPFAGDLERGDVTAYATAYSGFLRAVSEPVVGAVLERPERKVATLERLYGRIRGRLLAEPERYRFRYIVVAALLTRL
jgi:hypothetical protein